MKRIADSDESSPKRTCFDEDAVAISVLSLCVRTLSLFETRPELRLQHVCSELRTLYHAHLRTTALQLANSHRCPDAQLSWTQLSATVDESKSLAFTSQSFEDAALQLRQLSIDCHENIPLFLPMDVPMDIPTTWSCREQCQTQLLQCAERNDIVAWARLMQILRPYVTGLTDRPELSVGTAHFDMLYALLTSDSVLLCQDYLSLFSGHQFSVDNEELYELVSNKKHFQPLEEFPRQVLDYLAVIEEVHYQKQQECSLLGEWVFTDFFWQIIWSSVRTLDEAQLALRMIKPQYLRQSHWDLQFNRPNGCIVTDFLAALILDFIDRTDNAELWVKLSEFTKDLFPDFLFAAEVLRILDKEFDPVQIPEPKLLEFARWCLRNANEADDDDPWDIMESLHFACLLVATDNALGEDDKIAAKKELFTEFIAIYDEDNEDDRQPIIAKQFKHMAVGDCLWFCKEPKYLLYTFCYQTKHRTCSDAEYKQLRAHIRQALQTAGQESDEEWPKAMEFCTSLGKLRHQVIKELF